MHAGHRVGRGALFILRLALAVLALTVGRAGAAYAQDVLCDPNEREVHLVHFEGNTTFSDDELSSRVITTASSLTRRLLASVGIPKGGARRCYPETGLAPDVANLLNFYRANGFYDTRVDTVVTPAGHNTVDVTFRIREGQPLILDTLSITGLDSVANRDRILDRIPLKVGQRVGTILVNAAKDTITSSLENSGYPRADVFLSFQTHVAEHRAEVGLDVHTGAFARIGTIAIMRQGADDPAKPAIDSAIILRLLHFRSGDPYSARELVDAQNYLYSLGNVFRHVGIDTANLTRHGDSLIDIVVDVREDLMHQIDLDEGWGTLDCFRVNSQYTDKNFQDKAERLTLTGRLSKLGFGDFRGATPDWTKKHLCYRQMSADSIGSSKVNDYFGATIQYPTLFGTRWIPAYSVYTERRGQYKSYLRTTDFGASVSATHQFRFDMPVRIGYSLEHGATQADNAVLCGVFNRCSDADRQEIQERQAFGVASVAV
jgi:outer membrane protein assembly factor BamA